MKLNIGGKEINIKFGYKPTLKERILSRVAHLGARDMSDLETIEDLLLFLPEYLLVGMQVHHKDYRYDYDTKEGKEKQLDKAYTLIEKYMEQDGADALELYQKLEEALVEDSFLAALLQKEEQKIQETESKVVEMKQTETEEN